MGDVVLAKCTLAFCYRGVWVSDCRRARPYQALSSMGFLRKDNRVAEQHTRKETGGKPIVALWRQLDSAAAAVLSRFNMAMPGAVALDSSWMTEVEEP